MTSSPMRARFGFDDISSATQWSKLLLGLVAVFGLFHWAAAALGSDRGQAGILVGAIVIVAVFHAAMADRGRFDRTGGRLVVSVGAALRAGRAHDLGTSVLHFVIQGTVKLVVFPAEAASMFALVWIGACAIIPLGILAVPTLRAADGR